MRLEFGSSNIKTFSYTLNGIFAFCFLGNMNLHSQVAGGAIRNNNNPKTKIVEQKKFKFLPSHLCQPTCDGGLGAGFHGNRAAGLDFEDVLQNSDPLLQDVGRIGRQAEGLLLRDQLI